mmetsp:Transcript_14245/g.32788  ORF Transcript_14245/g.32788 Transcript_14245/m.32788 type:complete len:250 (+) Transcript_14245:117-866(+)
MIGFINITAKLQFKYQNSSITCKIFPKKQSITSRLQTDKILIYSSIFSLLIFPSSPVFASQNIDNNIIIQDESNILTKSSITYLEKSSLNLEKEFGFKIYFLSLRSLPYDVEIDKYAQDLFNQMNLGKKDVLVVLSSKLANGSIYWGEDVSQLNSKISESIIKDTYAVKAREEQYSSATIDVSNRLVSILSNKGDILPVDKQKISNQSNYKSARATEEKRSKYAAIIIILLVIAFVVPMVQFFYYVKDE